MIKAIIFDFDGLIIDTETVWYEAFKEVLESYEMDLSIELFSKVIGTHDGILDSMIRENLKQPVDIDIIKQAAADAFHSKIGEPVLREGVLDYLKAASTLGLRIALASSSSREWVVGFLEKLHILSYFEVIKTRDDVAEVKPDPELYVKTLEALGVQPTEAIAFEDSLNGLRAARAAGIHCVIVPNAVTTNLAFSDFSKRVSSMAECGLEALIEDVLQRKI
jgi:putative hydrolase of the HAD superfamily